MMNEGKKTICALLFLCVLLLSSCGPSLDFQREKEQGLYPTTSDFPNTQWNCREIDLCLYMFSYEESCMTGTYTVNGVSYRVVATFELDELNFEFYSSTDFSPSEYSDSMIHCDLAFCGFLCTKYSYDKETNTIVCSVKNNDVILQESIPDKLTFENVGQIAQKPNIRWYAHEIDMYLDSFSDVNGYFKGEITVGEEKHFVHALEVGNNGYFLLSVENGKMNNFRPGTTSPLIYMCFEIKDHQIIAKVSDEYLLNKVAFPYWSYDGVVTFEAIPF